METNFVLPALTDLVLISFGVGLFVAPFVDRNIEDHPWLVFGIPVGICCVLAFAIRGLF